MRTNANRRSYSPNFLSFHAVAPSEGKNIEERFCPDGKSVIVTASLHCPKQKSMKPTKSFTVETKRNGRRTVKTINVPIWEPHVLQSAMKAVRDDPESAPEVAETGDADSDPNK